MKLPLPRLAILERRTRLADDPHPVLALHEPGSLRAVLLLLDLANTNPPPQWTFLDRDQFGAQVATGHAPILGSFSAQTKSNFKRAKAFLTHLHLATM